MSGPNPRVLKRLISLILATQLLLACNSPGSDQSQLDTPGSTDSPGNVQTGLQTNQTLSIEGQLREYHLYLPEQKEHAAIVVLLHGHGSNNDELLGLTGAPAPFKVWLEIAERENLILLVPKGLSGADDDLGWNDCRSDATGNPASDDVAFIRQLISETVNRYGADARRVYVNGISNGGHMSIRLGLEAADSITAFAAVAAANAANSQCGDQALAVAAMFINGTADPILPYDGGAMASSRGAVLSAAQSVDFWVQHNSALSTPEISALANLNNDDDSSIEQHFYPNAANGAEVMLLKITGGGHISPSIEQRISNLAQFILGPQNGDIEMAEQVWSFFKMQSR